MSIIQLRFSTSAARMGRQWEARSAEALQDLGRELARMLPPTGAILLRGTLGAGKTTLAQGILAQLGVPGHVKSPSFDLVHPYELASGRMVWHVDLYRLETVPPPEELDVDPAAGLVLVEWGEAWRPYFPVRWEILLEVLPSGGRRVTVETWNGDMAGKGGVPGALAGS
jgi:tRNA threonylcarbamoyladenosine biosynthesis protein TsaE